MLISLVTLMFLFACKKDKETDPFDTAYTDETVEVSKANVEQNAIDMVDKLDELSSASGIKVLLHLYDLETSTPVKSAQLNPVMEPLALMSSVGDKSSIADIFKGMKLASESIEEDPLAFSALFDSIAGKYTYNSGTGEFDESELSDKVVIEFPGLEADVTNTAVITIDNFTVAEISDPMEQFPSGLAPELPKSVNVDLKYNGTSIAGLKFTASYQNDGMPTKAKVEMYVDDFTFVFDAVHSPYSSASVRNTLKFKDDILFETYLAAQGNWSEDNIGDNVSDTATHIEEIINNANAHLILMNLKVLGKVNLKVLGDSIWALDDRQEEITEQEAAQSLVDAINANAKLIVIYRDSNTKIAEAEAYVEQEWNDWNQEYDYYPAMRFIYADGSKVDVKTYVNNELDNFYVAMNDFIDKLNEEYGLSLGYVGTDK
jgi:hypothetical protein